MLTLRLIRSMHPIHHIRHAFTLIELLVVVAVIGLLAAMLMPEVGLIGDTADEVKCMNNLTGIGKAIKQWQILVKTKSSTFPQSIDWLYDDTKGGDLGVQGDIFLCPFDSSEGGDQYMGRPPSDTNWNSSTESPYVAGISYLYEVSGKKYPWNSPSNPNATWNQQKRFQKKFGRVAHIDVDSPDMSDKTTWGSSFPASSFPIVRCFHHQEVDFWTNLNNSDANSDVFNVSWGLNFFRSRPKWELDIPEP